MPEGITSLPSYCFYYCRSLTSITLPEGITSIGGNCFERCYSLTNITLPEGITSLGKDVFYACSKLTNIILPSTLKSIGDNALSPVKQIACQATTPPSCGTGCIASDCVLYVPKGTLDIYKNTSPWNEAGTILEGIPVSSLSLPKEFTMVKTESKTLEYTVYPEHADCETLDWLSDNPAVATVNNGLVTGVGVGTANIIAMTTDGSNLSDTCKVTVNRETVSICFRNISLQKGSKYEELTVTVLPEDYDHKNLVWTTSGNGVASVDANGIVTANKPGIDTVRCALDYDKDIYSECLVVVYDENVVYSAGYYYILNDEDSNDRWATLTSIYGGKNTSLDAKDVAQYYFGIIRIPEFIYYDGNKKYTVRKVGSYAFNGQTDVESIYIPRTVTEIEHHAAVKAEALNLVDVADESMLETIGNSAFYGCTALATVAWNGNSNLKTIQDYAFYKCSSLNNFDMPNTTLSVGNSAFRYNESLTEINLSTSLDNIDEYAFADCSFSRVTLPEHLQGLGSAAFENNSKLESVTFRTDIETMTIGNNAFNQCPILNKVYISNMKSFAQTNFSNAKANPANTSQHIYNADGAEITKVVLPKGTKYVNNNAFNGCAYIESIEVPSTMDHVNDDIFVGCSSLKDVYCYATEVPEFIGVNDPSTMSDVFKQATLHVVYGSESAYKADDWWGRFYQVKGCDNPYPEDVKVTSITISHEDVTLKPDDTVQLETTVYPTNAYNKKVLWSSSDEAVATVTDEGLVQAIAEGETDITAEAADGSGIKAVCHVKVEKEQTPIVKIQFEESPVTIGIGETKTMKVVFNPENATNKQLTWTSAKPSVVTVDQDGNIMGVSEGKSIVSAKTTDGSNLTINCIVTVTKTTGIGQTTVGDVKLVVDKRHLSVEGLADGDAIKVVNVLGFTVYEGTEHEVDLNAAGIYIVKAKGKKTKVAVK